MNGTPKKHLIIREPKLPYILQEIEFNYYLCFCLFVTFTKVLFSESINNIDYIVSLVIFLMVLLLLLKYKFFNNKNSFLHKIEFIDYRYMMIVILSLTALNIFNNFLNLKYLYTKIFILRHNEYFKYFLILDVFFDITYFPLFYYGFNQYETVWKQTLESSEKEVNENPFKTQTQYQLDLFNSNNNY